MGNHFYFITKNCDLDIVYLKSKPHKEIVDSLLAYVKEFNQIANEDNSFTEKIPYLKIKETDFLNRKIYFISCHLVDRVYKKFFYKKRMKNLWKAFMKLL